MNEYKGGLQREGKQATGRHPAPVRLLSQTRKSAGSTYPLPAIPALWDEC